MSDKSPRSTIEVVTSPDAAAGVKIRVAVDASVVGRTRTGTAVYVNNLLYAMAVAHPEDIEVLRIEGPWPRPHRHLFSRPLNLASELYWIHVSLPRLLKRQRVNILHMPANVIPVHAPCPCIVSVHDAHFITHPQSRDRIWLAYARLAISASVKRAAIVLTDSEEASGEIQTHLKADSHKMRVIYLGATKRTILPEDADFGRELSPYLLFTGATMLHKNVHNLVEAFAQLAGRQEFSNLKLVIAGVPADGHQMVIDAISRNRLENKVIFPGFISDSKLAALYSNAAVFVFPSKAEGFGLPPLEAMAQGTPVAAARASCIPEILGEAADYFNPDDPGKMAETIERILFDDAHSAVLIKRGYDRSSQFTWEKTAASTLDLYRETAKTSR